MGMFDAKIRPLIDPILNAQGARLAAFGVTANQVTVAGLALGLVSAVMIALGLTYWALVPLLASRLADGLDGAVARCHAPSDFGGYLDIVCDFVFYGAVPVGFVALAPEINGLAGAFLLCSFYANGASFLGYAVLAEKHDMQTAARGVKTLYFTGGILEGAETIGFFVLLCLWPQAFIPLAYAFGALCFATALSRVLLAARVFSNR